MSSLSHPLQFLLVALAGWPNARCRGICQIDDGRRHRRGVDIVMPAAV
jgi:hypothetical protein